MLSRMVPLMRSASCPAMAADAATTPGRFRQRHAIDGNAAFQRVVKAKEQVGQRALAGTRQANDGGRCPAGMVMLMCSTALRSSIASAIGEGDMLEADGVFQFRERLPLDRIGRPGPKRKSSETA